MKILGIHDGHNASACLLINGKIIMAIQEERLINEKNYIGFPLRSIKRILDSSNISISDIDYFAFSFKHVSYPPTTKEPVDEIKNQRQSIGLIKEFLKKTVVYDLYKAKRQKNRLNDLKQMGANISDKVVFCDHHFAHASAAYFGCPWRNDRVLVFTADGSGDGLCATVNIGENEQLTRIASTKKGHSLGNIYSRATMLMGFIPWEHEWKIMGMAPYASDKGRDIGYKVFQDLLFLSPENPLIFKRSSRYPTHLIYPELKKRSEYLRFDWLAAGLQKFTEDLIVEWVKQAMEVTGIKKVACAGGLFMNVKANKMIMELPELEDIFVFPSCGDDTTSIGAAYWVYASERKQNKNLPRIETLKNLYLGDDFNDDDVNKVLDSYKGQNNLKFKYSYHEDIEGKLAELIAAKRIVARCKGRMEFGARALGNRSILADPSDLSCVRRINMMIKKRDFWMPFAPMILKEREKDYIKNPKKINAPYMILSFDSSQNYKDLIAAAHQADLTIRPQVISEEMNPECYKILKGFEKITGRGVILNTSFNLHGYPIVHGPEEAMWVFENSELEILALGNYLITK